MLRTSTIKGETMKRKALGMALGGVALALMSVTAFGQLPGAPIRANIPFDFNVRGRTLPAGEYEISRISDEPGAMEIANIYHRSEHAVMESEPVQGRIPKRGEVVFHRYGDNYFLYEVWTPGMETGREIEPSKRERALERDLAVAGKAAEPETVAIAIN
jgi:hypothetical protein